MSISHLSPAISDPRELQRKTAETVNRISASMQPYGVRVVNANTTVDGSVGIYDCNATAGTITVTVGAPGGYAGKVFLVVKSDATANTVVITTGSVLYVLEYQDQTADVCSTGTRWIIR